MRQLAQQQPQMRLALLALGDVDRCAGQADNIARFIAQRFDMQIVPAQAGPLVERDFRAFRLAAREHFAFQGNDGRGAVRRQNLLIGVAENILDRRAPAWDC